jgi:EmrB/QacA subfamily drug resistance transporter
VGDGTPERKAGTSHMNTSNDPQFPPVAPSLVIPVVIASALFMENLDSTIIATSIPDIARSLGESPLRLNIAVTSYLLSLAVFTPISGWVADRLGTRTVFCSAIVLFTVSSALCGLSTNLQMMVATRVLQGLGGAMMTPVGRLILVRTFPKNALMQAMSYMTLPALIGPAMGPVVGGFLTTYISWRWIFYVNIPIGLIGIGMTWRFIANIRMPAPPPFDFVGFLIAGLGLCSFQFAVEHFGRHVLSAETEAGLFLLSAALMWLYVCHARHHDDPVLDLKLFAIRSFRISVLTGGLCRIGIGGTPFLLPLFFQIGFGMTAMQSGLLTFVTSLGAMLMKTVAPWLVRSFGFRRLLVGNAVLVGGMIAGLALFRVDSPHWAIWSYLLVFGFLRAVQFTSIQGLAYADLSQSVMSKGTSVASVAQRLAMNFGVAVAAGLLTVVVGPNASITSADFRWVFLLSGVIPLISAIGFLGLSPQDGAAVSGYRSNSKDAE